MTGILALNEALRNAAIINRFTMRAGYKRKAFITATQYCLNVMTMNILLYMS